MSNIAIVDWSLDVDCPKCGQNNNLNDERHDSENNIAGHLFNNRWEQLEGWEITCQHCGCEFKLDKVEY